MKTTVLNNVAESEGNSLFQRTKGSERQQITSEMKDNMVRIRTRSKEVGVHQLYTINIAIQMQRVGLSLLETATNELSPKKVPERSQLKIEQRFITTADESKQGKTARITRPFLAARMPCRGYYR